jgi:hypothetical protein
MERLVDVINIGPGRCATSWFHEFCSNHKEIILPDLKETEFFNNNYDNGFEWYEGKFCGSGAVRCEISNMYYLDEDCLRRIKEYNPSVKIIFNYRRPVDLFTSVINFGYRRGLQMPKSHYTQFYPVGMVMGSGFKYRLNKGILSKGDITPIFDSVLLSSYLETTLDIFGKENVFVFDYEAFKDEPVSVIEALCSFMNISVPRLGAYSAKKINEGGIARVQILGKIASSFAFFLRRFGFAKLLKYLHSSRVLKKILLQKKTTNVEVPDFMRDRLTLEDQLFVEKFINK